MDESATRRLKIDKALYASGWEQETFPESVILTEQRAYLISPGRVERVKTRHPKKVDYLLEYHGVKLAVIEAKSDELDVAMGVPQAKQYAELLQIRFCVRYVRLFLRQHCDCCCVSVCHGHSCRLKHSLSPSLFFSHL